MRARTRERRRDRRSPPAGLRHLHRDPGLLIIRTLTLALVVALLAAAPAAGARRVKVGDDYFVRSGRPPTVTVSKGTVVKWRWTGRRQHNVHVKRGPRTFTSALKRRGSYRRTMRRRGTYRIVCSIHQPRMRMTLIVR